MARQKAGLDELIEDLQKRMVDVVEAAKEAGRAEAISEIQRVVGSRSAAPPSRGSTSRAEKPLKRKLGKKRKNAWAGLTPEQKLERINAIRKGRGLPPKEAL